MCHVVSCLLGALLLSGCLPYAVGSTARIAPSDKPVVTSTLQFIPAGREYRSDPGNPDAEDDEFATSYPQVDSEIRFGLDERSDVGARFVGGSGFAVTYKRRVAGADPVGPGLALMGGGGILNVGNHAHLEATLIVSGSEHGPATPYGGLRVMQTIPLNSQAVSDSPTIGGFVGLKLGTGELAITPELGVFYDPSALDLRDSNWIAVPSLSVRGRGLFRRFF